ncbi:hypothetical protein PILCRDRAFT_303266 [Piloderma croceum F 1598]|uniref:Uncharacterized protein n=1 Tax=Piloderma croceum (strain F 1598) TaxID=765440 RepID=A0A0C3BL87_PILCF|nr:hypothetical protein PILCRDRAFT_303266 [Piloderma croceum F 1598]
MVIMAGFFPRDLHASGETSNLQCSIRVFTVALIGIIVLYGHDLHVFLYYKFLPGCWVWSSHSGILTQWHMCAVFLSVEGYSHIGSN